MKKILLMAALAFIGFSAKAQDVENHSNCNVEYRQFCFDPATCIRSYPGGGSWTPINAGTPPPNTAPLSISSCGAGTSIGFEVRYQSSTGCSNPAVSVVAGGTPLSCGVVLNARMGACSCTSNTDGLDVQFDGTNLVIHGS